MSIHDDLSVAAVAMQLEHHGKTVVFLPTPDTESAPFQAIVGPEADEPIEIDGSRERYRNRTVQIPQSVIADPRRPQQLRIASPAGEAEVWTIHERLGSGGGLTRVVVVRPVRQDTGGRSRR